MRTDSERLDWLERNNYGVFYYDFPSDPNFWCVSEDALGVPTCTGCERHTLRKAIDAAMDADEGGRGDG